MFNRWEFSTADRPPHLEVTIIPKSLTSRIITEHSCRGCRADVMEREQEHEDDLYKGLRKFA